jgi:hypothetical protein
MASHAALQRDSARSARLREMHSKAAIMSKADHVAGNLRAALGDAARAQVTAYVAALEIKGDKVALQRWRPILQSLERSALDVPGTTSRQPGDRRTSGSSHSHGRAPRGARTSR